MTPPTSRASVESLHVVIGQHVMPLPRQAGELLQLQRQQQFLISLKAPEPFQLVSKFDGQLRVVKPSTDQAFIDVLNVALVVRL